MTSYRRYAIYAAPTGALGDFGTAWLRSDGESRLGSQFPDLFTLDINIADITEAPRKYGFHGTLMAPFALVDGAALTELRIALAAFAACASAVAVGPLEAALLGRFLALAPVNHSSELEQLASRLVVDFERFRAPLTANDRARRVAGGLSNRQSDLLDRWGYPYVMEEFRFHLTLTGRLAKPQAQRLQEALAEHLVPILVEPYVIDDLALFGETDTGQFELIERFLLAG